MIKFNCSYWVYIKWPVTGKGASNFAPSIAFSYVKLHWNVLQIIWHKNTLLELGEMHFDYKYEELSQIWFICSKSTIEILEKDLKYVQN